MVQSADQIADPQTGSLSVHWRREAQMLSTKIDATKKCFFSTGAGIESASTRYAGEHLKVLLRVEREWA
jgi:hypothetical protein